MKAREPLHVHFEADELVALLVDGQRGNPGSLEEARGCQLCAEELAAFEATLLELRGALPVTEPAAPSATFASEVLARTTRKSASASRSPRVAFDVLRFVAVAAAVLLAVFAPSLAWLGNRSTTGPGAADPRELRGGGLQEFHRAATESAAANGARRAHRIQWLGEAISWTTMQREQGSMVGSQPGAGAGGPAGAARGRHAQPPPPGAGVLQRALWAEHLLDEALLEGRTDGRLAPALASLTDTAGSATPGEQLAALALERAREHGLLPSGLEQELAALRPRASGASGSIR